MHGSSWLTSLMVAGTALHAVAFIPYALQLAYGWTKLAIYQNLVAIAILLPLTLLATSKVGAAGVGFAWIAVNIGYLLFGIQFMHVRLLRGEKLRWYTTDIAPAFAGAGLAAVVLRIFLPSASSRIGALAVVLIATAATFVGVQPAYPKADALWQACCPRGSFPEGSCGADGCRRRGSGATSMATKTITKRKGDGQARPRPRPIPLAGC